MSDRKFTVCALFYGDYADLARRCLEPLLELCGSGLIDLRLGLNDVSKETEEYINNSCSSNVFVLSAKPQIFKYPMMRKLFNEKPVTTEYVMWFDDDSFIREDDRISWLESVDKEMSSCDMLGSTYTINYTQDQKAWCKNQKWYTGKTIPDRPKFATGGWWCLRSSVIKKFDWPIPELKHCGGDVALGVLLDQNNLKLKHYREGVAINADVNGKESAAERRGASKTEKPIGKV